MTPDLATIFPATPPETQLVAALLHFQLIATSAGEQDAIAPSFAQIIKFLVRATLHCDRPWAGERPASGHHLHCCVEIHYQYVTHVPVSALPTELSPSISLYFTGSQMVTL